MTTTDKTIQNIFLFATTYSKNGKHNEVWLKAQIANQLEHFRQEVVFEALQQERETLKEKIEGMKTGGGLRLDTFKEGYKSGYDKALDDVLLLLEDK